MLFDLNSKTVHWVSMKLGMQAHLMFVSKKMLQISQILSRTGDIHRSFSKKQVTTL